MAKKIKSYESAMQELEKIVANIQEGQTSIDNLAQQISRAAELMNYCKTKLRDTQTRIDEVLGEQ